MAETTYVLVHGAWMGAYCWSEITPRLEALGHSVLTPELPAHGDDPTPAEQASLEGYVQAVRATIGERREVVLVGHSMAGMVISAVAEAIPEQLRALVYVCAYLPRDGESLYQLAQEDGGSKTGQFWRPAGTEQFPLALIAEEGIVALFGPDCPPAVQDLLLSRHRAEPVPPFATPVTLSAGRYGTVPRVYVETLNDQVVSHQLQELMLSRVPVQRRAQLSSSHSPFFAQPDQLLAAITALP